MSLLHRLRRHVLAAFCLLITMAIVAPSSAPAFPNGRAPQSALARIYQPNPALHVYLRKDAAAAFNSMALLAAQDHTAIYVGGPLSAYRNFAGQTLLRAQWCHVGRCQNAAIPGTSNHGLGLAIDLARPTVMRPWIDRHGSYFGWCKCWSDAPWENWHVKFRPGVWHHRPDPGPDLANPRLRKGSGGRGQAFWVRQLQRDLHVHVDGQFGPGTARALRAFRHAHHLHGLNVTNPRVWALLRNPGPSSCDCSGHTPATPLPKPHKHGKPAPSPAPHPIHVAPALMLDVSNFQGSIDATAIAHAGVRAVINKTSEGLTVRDSSWTRARVLAIRHAHLILGVYHFVHPQPGRTGASEAKVAVAAARANGWSAKHDLPLVEDLETTAFPIGSATYQVRVKAWCDTATWAMSFAREVKAETGRWAMLYSGPGFLNAIPLSCRAQLGVLKFWDAHYGVKTPIVPAPWSNTTGPGYTAWQYTGTGTIPGVHGHVDLSLVPGGVPALQRLASAG